MQSDCGKAHQDCTAEFYFVHVEFEWSVFYVYSMMPLNYSSLS